MIVLGDKCPKCLTDQMPKWDGCLSNARRCQNPACGFIEYRGAIEKDCSEKNLKGYSVLPMQKAS